MLLIAVILMAVFCCTPFASVAVEGGVSSAYYVKDAPVFLTLNIVAGVLLFASIFMYKDLRRQMRVTMIALVLVCASIVTAALIMAVGIEGATPVIFGGVSLLVLVLLFGILAYRGMKHDHRLLASADRLR